MTTVVYDGYDLACDGRADNDGKIVTDSCSKIYDIPGGWIGCAGTDGDIEIVVKWLRDGGKAEDKPIRKSKSKLSFESIVVDRDGKCFCLDSDLILVPYDPPQGCGSGWIPAVTAIHLGKTAKEAVEVAKKMDCFTGGKVTVIHVRPRPKGKK